MERVYISSTVADLEDYRRAVIEVLRNCGCDVDSMEKYPARDERPKDACEADAAECDIYVGIFAWRYGFVPDEDNPGRKSITELEYIAAGNAGKDRIVFLLDENFPWPPMLFDAHQDGGGAKIRDLRSRLKNEKWVSTFKTPDDLASKVMTTIIQKRSTKKVDTLSEFQNINDAKEFGPSYLPNIQAQISQPNSQFVSLRLGPVPWWDTRLHLAAAMTSDFTEIRQFVLLDSERRYLTMASPTEIRRALANSALYLEPLYYESRSQARVMPGDEINNIFICYPGAVYKMFDHQQEKQIKRVITPTSLRELGIRSQGEVLNLTGSENWSNQELMRRQAPYVAVMRDGTMEGVIDRMELTSQIASQVLKM